MLIDRYGRPLTHARVSITSKCNYSCVFCHKEGVNWSTINELSPEDWSFFANVVSKLGIVYFKLTGGEPLTRSDVASIVRGIKPYVKEVSMTTNGSLLNKYAEELLDSGLDRVNVSLHSLNREVFKKLTGGILERVIKGVEIAISSGLVVKLDYLVTSLNAYEYRDVINYAESLGVDLNIIELIPLGLALEKYAELYSPLSTIEKYLEEAAVSRTLYEFQSRPTYVMPSGIKVTLVKGTCNPELCASCTRIRVTPEGKLKTCIYTNEPLIDAGDYICKRDEEGLIKALVKANEFRKPFFSTNSLQPSQ
ncbi:MAG: GTP 3',8-cyclase MoaA [Sulfolobales archaeon]|nr:GTP 3',8-cyclase MoaA [Sulfolobales archaeon]MCX8198728.1 GTP 3',8-cyclase MoaA [Sulfolobales archaeon]MDW8169801.1 GTP 3',8-cyclase MoaA [Desulfurococcaceae archaeon]